MKSKTASTKTIGGDSNILLSFIFYVSCSPFYQSDSSRISTPIFKAQLSRSRKITVVSVHVHFRQYCRIEDSWSLYSSSTSFLDFCSFLFTSYFPIQQPLNSRGKRFIEIHYPFDHTTPTTNISPLHIIIHTNIHPQF